MKILILTPNLKRGGAERVLSELSIQWAKNHDVILSLFDKKDIAYSYGGIMKSIGYPAKSPILYKMYNFLMRIKVFYKLTTEEKPDIIISFTESANFIAIITSFLSGNLKKTIVSVRVAPERFKFIIKIFIFLFYRFSYRIVSPSEGIQTTLKNYGLPKKKLKFIPNPVAIRKSLKIKSKLFSNLNEKEFILGAGRLEHQKGFDILIKSFSKIEDKKIKLVILGEGSQKEKLIKLAKIESIEPNRIIFPGSVENISSWFKKAKFFTLSSRYEGWPNVLMESLANGCPAIAFDCKHGPREIIKNNENGILVGAEDKDKLIEAINTLNSSIKMQKNFKKNGLKTAKKYKSEIIANKWFQLL
jgi:GalNAc-alpha-(1->4)-GalNAc-alpha-(1->3)-diNAcBac-PP-undecaprenol alpha-1,4-N-acetyl-D-galactosaminyltransferase